MTAPAAESGGTCPAHFVALANRLAEESGAVVRRYFRRKLEVTAKADASPVTQADREAEAAIRATLKREAPDHGIWGEEFGVDRIDAEYVWVVDPIDGTKSFISGFPLFGTLIALVHHGRPVLGIIDHPALRERWVGAVGCGATFCGEKIRTRGCAAMKDATLFSTSPDMFRGTDAAAYGRLRARVGLSRFGGDCYAYGQVASGNVDLVVEAGLKPYDYLAMVPILAEAGGLITDWSGGTLDLKSGGRVIAAGDRRAHAEAIKVLAG